jgi:6-phosphogluconolactonase
VGEPVKHDVRIFATGEEVSRAAALSLIDRIKQSLGKKNSFSLVLSGGQTLKRVYEILAAEFHKAVPWSRVSFYMGDERFVPPDDPRSNFKMIKESLLNHLPISQKNVYPMPTSPCTPEEAATSYEKLLRSHFEYPLPKFDLALLGMGADGHTASLFPNSAALDDSGKWVTVGQAPVEPRTRLTLTLAAINNSEWIFFLVTGKEKARALKFAFGDINPDFPASMVRPGSEKLIWWVDESASSLLGK